MTFYLSTFWVQVSQFNFYFGLKNFSLSILSLYLALLTLNLTIQTLFFSIMSLDLIIFILYPATLSLKLLIHFFSQYHEFISCNFDLISYNSYFFVGFAKQKIQIVRYKLRTARKKVRIVR